MADEVDWSEAAGVRLNDDGEPEAEMETLHKGGRATLPDGGGRTAHGCPCCDWSGEVARTHDYDHRYYTHVIVRDGEVFRGQTCSERTRPRRPHLLDRLLQRLGVVKPPEGETDG